MQELIVITDTSVLINFLVLEETERLLSLPGHNFAVTEHVRAEITAHYPEQLQQLRQAIESGALVEIQVTDPQELSLFAQLTKTGLGVGECSAFAVAVNRKHRIAIDDKRAIKKLHRVDATASVLRTMDLVVLLIKANLLTVEEADRWKTEWETHHRFRIKLGSFRELL